MRGATSILVVVLVIAACGTGAASPTPQASPSAPVTEVMASGQLVAVDGTASGTAKLVVMGEVYEVVLEDFEIASIEHTNLILVPNAAVTMSDDIDPSMILDLGPLQSTSGMQVYPVPAHMAASLMSDYHSVVIWDTAMSHVLAAAALQ